MRRFNPLLYVVSLKIGSSPRSFSVVVKNNATRGAINTRAAEVLLECAGTYCIGTTRLTHLVRQKSRTPRRFKSSIG